MPATQPSRRRSATRNAYAHRALAEACEPRRLLAALTWDGGGDGVTWGDPLNWSNDLVPGANDDVTLDVPGDLVVELNGFRTVNSLDNAETINVSPVSGNTNLDLAGDSINRGTINLTSATGIGFGATLQGAGTLTNTGTIRAEPGAQSANATRSLSVNLLNQGELVADGVTLPFTGGTFTLNGGSVTGDVPLRGAAVIATNGDGPQTLRLQGFNNRLEGDVGANVTVSMDASSQGNGFLTVPVDVTNFGTIRLSSTSTIGFGSNVQVDDGVTLTNAAGGAIRASSGVQAGGSRGLSLGTGSVLDNQGLLTADDATSFTVSGGTVSTFGTLGAEVAVDPQDPSAQLQFTSTAFTITDGTASGEVRLSASDISLLGGTATLSSVGSNNRLLAFDAPAATLVHKASNVGNAFLTVPGDATVAGELVLSSSSTIGFGSSIDVSTGATLTVPAGGSITAEPGVQTTNSQRSISLAADAALVVGGSLTSDGVDNFIVNMGDAATVTSDGELRGVGGELRFSGSSATISPLLNITGGTLTGQVRAGNSLTLDVSGVDGPSVLSTAGVVNVSGLNAPELTLRVVGSQFGNSTLRAVGDVTSSASLVLGADSTIGFAATIDVPTGASFTATGPVTAEVGVQTSGSRGFTGEGLFTSAGTFTVDENVNITGNGNVRNTGTLVKNAAGLTTFSPSFDNDATVDLDAGTLRFSGTTDLEDPNGAFLSGGRYLIADGASLQTNPFDSNGITLLTAEIELTGTADAQLDVLRTNRGAIRLLDGADLTIDPSGSNGFRNEGILDLSSTSTLSVVGNVTFGGVSQPVIRSGDRVGGRLWTRRRQRQP